MRMRSLVAVPAAAVLALTVGGLAASPASAAPTPTPTRAQLTSAMLTFPQMKRLGLVPLSGAGASYSGEFDPSLRFSTHNGQIDSYTFADSSSPGDHDKRSVMIVVSYGAKSGAKVVCRIDEGSPQRRVATNACVSERHPSGVTRPVGVSYGIKPAAGVNVIAYVSDDPVSTKPSWKYPTTAQLIAAAKKLATKQVARLRTQGLIPAQ